MVFFEANSAFEVGALREKYLRDVHGLQVDPFSTTKAEEEPLNLHYSYAVLPICRRSVLGRGISSEINLDKLSGPKTTIITAPAGGGRTTLARLLSAERYKIRNDVVAFLRGDIDQGRILQTIAGYFVLRNLEVYEELIQDTQALARVISTLGPQLREKLEETLRFGYKEQFYQALGEPFVLQREMIREPIQEALRFQGLPLEDLSELVVLIKRITQGKLSRVTLIIDADKREDAKAILNLEPQLSKVSIYPKIFLPDSLQELIRGRHFERLEIIWPDQKLAELVQARFQAVGSYKRRVEDLFELDLAEKIDPFVLKASRGNPRRLLQIINGTIDAHVQYSSSKIDLLDRKDYNMMVENWPTGDRFKPPKFVV